MGASQTLVNEGVIFTKVLMGGSLSIILLFMINGIFRGAGNAAIAMKSLWIASLLNIVLCPILIYQYGILGAALATLIGRTGGVVYQIYQLINQKVLIKISWINFNIQFDLIKSLIQVAWPATFQFFISSGSWIVLSKLVAETGGTEASAAYQIAIRNVVFFILPAWGLSNAAATLVGQNLGAGKPDRVVASVRLSTIYNGTFMAIVMLLFVFFSKQIIGFYTIDPKLIEIGSRALQIIAYGYLFYGVGMVMTQALNGAGDTKTPTWIFILGFWFIQIPLAYYLAKPLGFGPDGVFWAIPIAETFMAVISTYFFYRGKWKNIQV
jgi:putative MATE family efflux protein